MIIIATKEDVERLLAFLAKHFTQDSDIIVTGGRIEKPSDELMLELKSYVLPELPAITPDCFKKSTSARSGRRKRRKWANDPCRSQVKHLAAKQYHQQRKYSR